MSNHATYRLGTVKASRTRSVQTAGMLVTVGLLIAFVCAPHALAQQMQASAHASATDWPTYMHDATRGGVTPAQVSLPLAEQWVYEASKAPQPAWPEPQDAPMDNWGQEDDRGYRHELPRMKFDAALHVAVADGAVYFGSSVDNAVYSVEADTGEMRWRFFTEGPVRLAPTVYEGRVYVGSDDGYVYCLAAGDGTLVWKFRAGPTDQRILGRGRMTSLWPVRTGVVVDDGVAYFGAGIFPGERVYICAVDAEDGALIWQNALGERDAGRFDFSPQGYMLASQEHLFVPSGRTLPACFARDDGHLVYKSNEQWPRHGDTGGSYALLTGDLLYAGTQEKLIAYLQDSAKHRFAWSPAKKLVVTADVSYLLDGGGIRALDRAAYEEEGKKDAAALEACTVWRWEHEGLESMVLAGELLFAGGRGEVIGIDTTSGEEVWRAEVEGRARGLAVAGGSLFVSTDSGNIHCLGEGAGPASTVGPKVTSNPYPRDELTPLYQQAADTIVEEAGVDEGYCLVLGCGEGRLAYELARRTDLTIYGIDPDASKVEQGREALSAAGNYGTRICIDQGNLDSLPYPDYFANLVVCDGAIASGRLSASASEAFRVLKPCGGVLFVGRPSPAEESERLSEGELREWAASAQVNGDLQMARDTGTWAKLVRGPLEGAGSWTHQYGNAGNRGSSDDRLVQCPLGVLWYGDPGPSKFPSRHTQNTAPLSINGRVFAQGVSFEGAPEGRPSYASDSVGKHLIMCFDAYNGLMYWEREIPGAYRRGMSRECSNLACNDDSLFVAAGSECLQLDTTTGRTKATFRVPSSGQEDEADWAYVAVADGVLFGSTFSGSQHSDTLFAIDIASGERLWVHEGKKMRNNAIAVSDGRVFFADDRATAQQRRQAVEDRIEQLEADKDIEQSEIDDRVADAYVWMAVALDAATGRTVWEKPVDLSGCNEPVPGNCGVSAICSDGVLLFCTAVANGHHWQKFLAGVYAPLPGVALSAEDGSLIWRKALGYRTRPLVNGDTLYAEPWAFDLHTGEQKMRAHPLTGERSAWQFERPGHHCGTVSACPNALFFRSYFTGYYDLATDQGTFHFAGYRPGCWINIVPANGLVIQPDASSGCICMYSLQSTIVFQPRKPNKAWGIFSDSADTKPVKHMHLNVGAPGDRRASDGTLWLSQPRRPSRMGVRPRVQIATMGGGGYYNRAVENTAIQGAGPEWVYASGCRGVTKCTVPLIDPGQGSALYTVRLCFADPDNSQPGWRPFDIKLQGDTVERDFDIVAAAGGAGRAVVRQYEHVHVNEALEITFVPAANEPAPHQTPVLSGIEILREKVLHVGMTAPGITLNDTEPSKALNVKLDNNTESTFTGTLEVATPDQLRAEVGMGSISLAPAEEMTVPVTISVAQRGEKAQLQVACRLVGADGNVAVSRTVSVEYLGPRSRVAIAASADTYVSAGSPGKNFGQANNILVDGGASKMGDESHNIGYLRFPLDVPGTPISATFRIHVPSGGHTQSGDSGVIRLVEGEWEETGITYDDRPPPGEKIGTLGRVAQREWVERTLDVDLADKKQLNIVLEPTSTDGATYDSRETGTGPELVIEYEAER